MWIPILSRRLGRGDESAPIPLWRDPEISVADWLIQCFIPYIVPLKKATRRIKSNGGDIEPIETIRSKTTETTDTMHDKQFAAWQTTQLQVRAPSAHPLNQIPGTVRGAAAAARAVRIYRIKQWPTRSRARAIRARVVEIVRIARPRAILAPTTSPPSNRPCRIALPESPREPFAGASARRLQGGDSAPSSAAVGRGWGRSGGGVIGERRA